MPVVHVVAVVCVAVAIEVKYKSCTGSVGIGHLAVTVKPVPSTILRAGSEQSRRKNDLPKANQGFSRHGGVLDYFRGFIG